MDTGIRQIDMQHQELVSLINEMERAQAGGRSSMALDDILPSLTTCALLHFGDEELLLAQVAENTTFAEHHLKEHRNFVDEIQRLIAHRASQSDSDLVTVLTLYLADWLVLHISGTDRVLARVLLSKSTPKWLSAIGLVMLPATVLP